MSPTEFWRGFEGNTIDGRVRLLQLTAVDPSRVIAAEFSGESDFGSVVVRFHRQALPPGSVLNRYLEAAFLDHPHLLKCYGAGTFSADDETFTYAILEPWEERLSEAVSAGPLQPDIARYLGLHLIDGLEYLHANGLVYCNASPLAVVKAGGVWKLGDYSQMRIPGAGYGAETKRLLAIDPGTPPEAYQGIVSPAWDVWSLTTLLVNAVSVSSAARVELPAPFGQIAAECFEATPDLRCKLDRIREMLREPSVAAPPATREPPPAVRHPRELSSESGAAHERYSPRHWPPSDPPRERRFGRRALGLTIALVTGGLLVLAASIWGDPRETSSKAAPPVAVKEKPDPTQPANADRVEPVIELASEVEDLLNRWVAATRERNADKLSALYAPTVERFFRARNVSRDWVQRDRSRALSRAGAVRRFEIDNIRTRQNAPDQATVTFDKTWEFARGSGKSRSQLVLRKIGGEWLIASERDL